MERMAMVTPSSLRSPRQPRPLRGKRRHCSLSVVSAGSFEMRSELRLIVRVGSRSESIERHMASIQPIVFRLTPTVQGVSHRWWRHAGQPRPWRHCWSPNKIIGTLLILVIHGPALLAAVFHHPPWRNLYG